MAWNNQQLTTAVQALQLIAQSVQSGLPAEVKARQATDAAVAALATRVTALEHTTAGLTQAMADLKALMLSTTAPPSSIPLSTPPPPPITPPAPVVLPSDMTNITATVSLADGAHLFDIAKGIDLGTFIDPRYGISMRNIVVRDATIPFTVFFRPETDNSRLELKFAWGDTLSPLAAGRELPAHTVQITVNGAVRANMNVPKHYWLSDWRWQSIPRVVKRTAAQVIVDRLLPPFDKSIATVGVTGQVPAYTIMGTSSLIRYMPQTGQSGDYEMGLLNEHAACYVATENADSLYSMMTWGECSLTFPWHVRDAAAGYAPVSLVTYPSICFDASGRSPTPNSYQGGTADGITIDAAHFPCLWAGPYAFTGDPTYLEEVQLSLTVRLASMLNQNGIMADQTRGTARDLRDLLYLIKMMPDMVPGWLLPKSYWQGLLNKNVKWFTDSFINNPGSYYNPKEKTDVFRSATESTTMPMWQEAELCGVIGYGEWAGLAGINALFDWKIQQNIDLSSGVSGWPRTLPAMYHPIIAKDANGNLIWAIDAISPPGTAYTMANSYAELAALNGVADTADGNLNPSVDLSYVQMQRAALAWGARNGRVDAVSSRDWLTSQMKSANMAIEWRWAL